MNTTNSNLPCSAEIYLKFDKYGLPEYGYDFDAKTRTLTKFRQLTNRPLTSIELPIWEVPYAPVPLTTHHESMLTNQQAHQERLANQPRLAPLTTGLEDTLADYAQGGVTIATGCFQGQTKLRLLVPGDYAVQLADGCFDANADVTLVTASAVTVKRVNHTHQRGSLVTRDSWTLLAHQNFAFHGTDNHHGYRVSDCDTAMLPYHLTIDHPQERHKLSTCLIPASWAKTWSQGRQPLTDPANTWVRQHEDLHAINTKVANHLHPDRER